MTDITKVKKLLDRVDYLIAHLNRLKDFRTHRRIDQFFYMQKAAELKFLCNELVQSVNRQLADRLDESCCDVFFRWRVDIRWLARNQVG